MIKFVIHVLTIMLVSCYCGVRAQEGLKPLRHNLNYIYSDLKVASTIKNPSTLKTQTLSLNIPFIEDFYYAPMSSYPDQSKWSDRSVYVNSGFPINPPSIGVATFDGLNRYGYPHHPTYPNNSLTWPSDTLTSRDINLLTTVTSQTLLVSDSLALSFYYQARGYGDAPETIDSLILDLYNPRDTVWNNRVWFAKGNINGNIKDTIFKRGFVKIDSAIYLKDGFKFRFRNKSAGSGNYDHWHLDYIYLDKDRSFKADTAYKDITFGYVPTPFLKDYSAMPFEQYIPSERANTNIVKIKNNDGRGTPGINMTYGHIIDAPSQTTYTYNGGAAILFPFRTSGYSSVQAHATPSITYVFPSPLPDSIDFRIKHYIFESGSPTDFIRQNDTVVQYQRFRNYYALDDGSAEAGYYVNAALGKVAVKINVNVPDSFLATRIYFDPVESVATLTNSAGFRINIWPSTPNGPGNTPLYTDTLRQPTYYNSFPGRSFAEYKLKNQLLLQPGVYYIGIQQRADYMTIGFDMNVDHSATTYYDDGSGWKVSEEKGSVMIRPVFGKTLPPYVGLKETNINETRIFSIYPNPTSGELNIHTNNVANSSYSLLSVTGQVIKESAMYNAETLLNLSELSNGLYLLVLKIDNSPVQQQKIIIQH